MNDSIWNEAEEVKCVCVCDYRLRTAGKAAIK